MSLFSYYSFLLYDKIGSDPDDFYFKRTDGSRMSFDDSFIMRIKQNSHRYIQLCNSPRLSYLNLLDNEDKLGDFQSSLFEGISLKGNSYIFSKAFDAFEQFICASMFNFFVKYLKGIPRDSIDLQVFDRRIFLAAEKLLKCDSYLIHAIFEDTIRLYCDSSSEKILLPLILKHVCTVETLITYAVDFLLNFCKERFFRELLDACIETRFSFWTLWERNFDSRTMPICPVTLAYSSAKLDLLKVLLDYGFHQAHQRVRTLETVLEEHVGLYNYLWVKRFLFNDGQSSRSVVVDEVFLFVTFIFGSFTSSEPIGKCFLLTWAARKDPYVTRRELFRRLPLLRSEQCKLFRSWFKERYDVFQTSLPRYPGIISRPRSLKHLCRCTVREMLNDNWKMPHGVATLPIPETVKSYLLLK